MDLKLKKIIFDATMKLWATLSARRDVKYIAVLAVVVATIRLVFKVPRTMGDADPDEESTATNVEGKGDLKRVVGGAVLRLFEYLRGSSYRRPQPSPKPATSHPHTTPNASPSTGSALSHNAESFNRSNVTVIGGNLICNSITTIYLTPNSPYAPHSNPIPQPPRNTL
ncbi:hypothetical protein AX16_005304 [Volvariella volvacea WC 439]|nr:hypothetical protein AX16_005304 [Volvariella volvacea WC 439]